MPKRETCLGLPDRTSKEAVAPIIPCDKPPEEGEDWCKECGEEMDRRFRGSWLEIAQMEAPHVDPEDIKRGINRIVGPGEFSACPEVKPKRKGWFRSLMVRLGDWLD